MRSAFDIVRDAFVVGFIGTLAVGAALTGATLAGWIVWHLVRLMW